MQLLETEAPVNSSLPVLPLHFSGTHSGAVPFKLPSAWQV
jgi:hypothetical protein